MTACDESANQEFQGGDDFDIIKATSAASRLFPRHSRRRTRPPHIVQNRFPVASYVQKNFWLKIAIGVCGPEFAFTPFKHRPFKHSHHRRITCQIAASFRIQGGRKTR
jgi:hypothetical protein